MDVDTRSSGPNPYPNFAVVRLKESQTIRITLKVSTTATQFVLAEGGDYVNVKGAVNLFAVAQTVTP
jgi:hypothetical protein